MASKFIDPINSNILSNFIYFYHTNEWLLLPEYPDSVADSMSSTFSQTQALSRTAPVFTYSYSGPRRVQFQVNLHRDMLHDLNDKISNFLREEDTDYVDELLKRIQAIALPRYDATQRGVVPPMVAVRLGNEVFVKGVVVGGVSIQYQKPIMDDGRYAIATINFEVCEVDPYDAESIGMQGSFRGITKIFENGIQNRRN